MLIAVVHENLPCINGKTDSASILLSWVSPAEPASNELCACISRC